MSSRKFRVAGLALLAGATLAVAADELIRIDRLTRPVPPFKLRRDIFQGIPVSDAANRPVAGRPMQPITVETVPVGTEEPISEEIFRSIGYAGCITRNNRRIALLNISGDFQQAGEGDTVLERFKVKSIRPDAVIIEFEDKTYEIRLTGDNHG